MPPPQSPVQSVSGPLSTRLRAGRSPRTPTRPSSQPGTLSAPRLSALRRAAVGQAAPRSARPAAAAAAGDWLRPAPPAAPPSSSVENSGAHFADARRASRQAARRPRPGGAAPPRPEPAQRPWGLPADSDPTAAPCSSPPNPPPVRAALLHWSSRRRPSWLGEPSRKDAHLTSPRRCRRVD